MRILNRVIVAGALVVPMALGATGVAAADVAAGSWALPTQMVTAEQGSDDCDICPCDDEEDDGDFLTDEDCREDDDDEDGGLLGLT